MATRPPLARSSTSTRTLSRPMSAQSTLSNDSNATQPLPLPPAPPPAHAHHHPLVPPQMWPPQGAPPMHFQQHAVPQNPHGFPMLDASMTHYHTGSTNNYAQAAFSFERLNSPALSSVESDMAAATDTNGEDAPPKKKASGASLANDAELRRMYRDNSRRSLQEVAAEVKREHKGPKAEKSKQVFGMLWLSRNITKSKQSSVPRGRVYSMYASRCGDDNLQLLNPASFGKLVRIIFPNVQTRRLGVRGESKYNYVGLALVQDESRGSVPPGATNNVKPDLSRPPTASLPPQPPTVTVPDRAVFPSFGSPLNRQQPTRQPSSSKTSTIYLQHSYASADTMSIPTRKDIIGRKLCWPDPKDEIPEQNSPLELPAIEQFLPPGSDPDAAYSLFAVYRSHCLQAIESFRFCKSEEFGATFKSLIGLLTVPSQKLLGHPQLAAWVEACDTMKYKRMVALIHKIVLNKLPAGVMRHMELVAEQLCSWIHQYFATQPQHVLDAMLRPASTFVSVLSRFIRVNRSAHDVSPIFSQEKARDELLLQWVRGSQPLQVVEGTFDSESAGHHRLLSVLTHELVYVLRPSAEATEAITNGFFLQQKWSGLEPPGFLAFKAGEDEFTEKNPREPYWSRLAHFLEDIPKRYPGVKARKVLNGMETALGIAGRNMALNNPDQGLGHFYTVSLFCSEYLHWQAECGGFLGGPATSSPLHRPYTSPYEAVNGMGIGSNNGPIALPNNVAGSLRGHESADTMSQQDKAPSLEASNSWPIEVGRVSKGRVSLGGETAVGDEDFPLEEAAVDWGSFEKVSGQFFDHDNSNVMGVNVG